MDQNKTPSFIQLKICGIWFCKDSLYRKDTEPFISCFHVLTCNTSFQYLSIHAMAFIACYNYMLSRCICPFFKCLGWAWDKCQPPILPPIWAQVIGESRVIYESKKWRGRKTRKTTISTFQTIIIKPFYNLNI